MNTPDNPPLGHHIIIDMYDCAGDMLSLIVAQNTLQDAAKAAKAEVINISGHDFGEGQGVTALALLAESHISVHSWPEKSYVAADIFTCGQCDSQAAASVFIARYRPQSHTIKTLKRGERS